MATFIVALLCSLCLFCTEAFAEEPMFFGVLNQRSATLTAQYWNPILNYVSAKSGVPLRLKMGRTAPETTAMTVRGDFATIEKLALPHARSPYERVTVSIGVAVMIPENNQQPELLIHKADSALYHAKNQGRNRVEISGRSE